VVLHRTHSGKEKSGLKEKACPKNEYSVIIYSTVYLLWKTKRLLYCE